MLPKADEINNHFELFIPESLNITDAGKIKEIVESIRKFYFDGKALTSKSVSEFVKVKKFFHFNDKRNEIKIFSFSMLEN